MVKKIEEPLQIPYIVFGVLFVLLLGVYLINYIDIAYPKTYVPDILIETNTSDFSYVIDDVNLTNGFLTMQGWALIKGQRLSGSVAEASYWDISIVVYDKNESSYKKIMTQFQLRNDVTEAFKEIIDYQDVNGSSIDYSSSGFFSSGKLSGELADYEFYILYRNNNVNRLIKIEV